ncbi:single-stranded DNA-binding protein [Pseudothermotoga thermarum]|uniref:Single-stranded DNA-binding protein n=1 Tax=Pseudothermotoga thermarum DSM 5069 TaxID=688269 RepID=F7YUV7_9THEM|nr:single-stranded DNA-binding protein [Pseudothermotoga thermarum]AEH51517.1 single-strand binding protein [Pseudothermotoga thermarum DSM 5069]
MPYFNRVILVGRITRDPETRYTTSGRMVATFNLAVNRPPRPDAEEVTDFIRIVTFGKLAEFAKMYLKKGQLILVEGELRLQRWQARDGTTRTTAEIWARDIRFLERKSVSETVEPEFEEEEETEFAESESQIENSDEDIFDDFWRESENPDEPPF